MLQVRVHGPGDVRLDNVPEPDPGPGDALVRVAACGICGTDLTSIALGGIAGPGPEQESHVPPRGDVGDVGADRYRGAPGRGVCGGGHGASMERRRSWYQEPLHPGTESTPSAASGGRGAL